MQLISKALPNMINQNLLFEASILKKNWLKLSGKTCKFRQNLQKLVKIYRTGKISTQMCTL